MMSSNYDKESMVVNYKQITNLNLIDTINNNGEFKTICQFPLIQFCQQDTKMLKVFLFLTDALDELKQKRPECYGSCDAPELFDKCEECFYSKECLDYVNFLYEQRGIELAYQYGRDL